MVVGDAFAFVEPTSAFEEVLLCDDLLTTTFASFDFVGVDDDELLEFAENDMPLRRSNAELEQFVDLAEGFVDIFDFAQWE